MSWEHTTEVRASRGKTGGYNVVCSRCDWHKGPFRDRNDAESFGRQHCEVSNRPYLEKGLRTEKE
jgi:hypothetical protein